MEAHMLEQARRAVQTVDRDWMPVAPIGIGGVHLKELKNVVIRSGILTECFRPEWFAPPRSRRRTSSTCHCCRAASLHGTVTGSRPT